MSERAYALLGPMEVGVAGAAVDAGGPKQRAVLALLLINANHPLTPDRMIDELWGEHPPSTATATLQAYVSNLRKILEPGRPARAPASVLITTGGGYQLAVRDGELDVARFEALAARGSDLAARDPQSGAQVLREALGIWRGPALADFRYEPFAQAEITRLEELRVTTIEQRIAADLAAGRAGELVPEVETLLGEHPLRERLWGHLMLALYRSGRQAEALRAYRRCEERLRDELGIVPGESLRELELAILSQDAALIPAQPADPVSLRDDPSPLVGRQVEQAAFAAAMERAAASVGSVMIVEGEAGIGKTRLLEAFVDAARATGCRAAFARCVEVGGAPPFWPWMQLAKQLDPDQLVAAAGSYGRYLAPLLPATDHPPAPTQGAPLFHLSQALAAALAKLAADRPVLAVIDDLYSADPDSLSLLTLLAAELRDAPVIIVGTHRGQDLGAAHPLTATLADLARLGRVTRLPLRRLDVAESADLVERHTGRRLADATLQAIHDRTEGNAFYTIEMAKLMADEPRREAGADRGAVPATVMEVMGRRLGLLSDDARRVVRVGAVYGREFDLGVAIEALDLDLDAAVPAVDEALRSGLLLETGAAGTYRFSHVIVVDCVTRSLGAVRRAHIHQHIADALERRYAHDPSRWGDIAHHRRQAVVAAGAEPAIDALARAGEHAMQSTALALAEELFTERLALVLDEPRSAARDRMEQAALFDLARLWTWREGYHSPRLGAAAVRLCELAGIPDRVEFPPGLPITSTDPVLSALQARFSHEIVCGRVDASHQVALDLQALAVRHPDPMVALAAGSAACVVGVHAPYVTEALAGIDQAAAALAVLDPSGSQMVMLPLGQQAAWVTHHAFAGWARWLAGDRGGAAAELDAARALCDRGDHAFTRSFCMSVEGLVAAMDGSPEWVARTVAWERMAAEDGVFGLFDTWRTMLDAWAGGMQQRDPARAADLLRAALADLAADGALVVQTLYWGMVAELELRAGLAGRALDAARHGLDLAEATGERFWYPELERLAARAQGALGRNLEGRAAMRRGEAAARELGLPLLVERFAAAAAR